MHFFPPSKALATSSGSRLFGFEQDILSRSEPDFSKIFNTFMTSSHEDAPHQASRHDMTPVPERTTTSPGKSTIDPAPLPGDPPASGHQQALPAEREDFARLREKLEELGVDKEILDRAVELFDSSGPVTWGQVYEILRETLAQKANITLTAEQKQDILSLFSKMGFTPLDAKALLNDLLDNKYDAVWKKVQQMLLTLKSGNNLSVAIREIASLLKALGLDIGNLAKTAMKQLDPDTQNALQKVMDNAAKGEQKLNPDTMAALKTILAAARQGARLEAETLAVLQKVMDNAAKGEQKLNPDTMAALKTILAAAKGDARSEGETLAALQKVVDAAVRGEIKLDPDTMAAVKKAVETLGAGVKLEQAMQQLAGKELSPEELRNLLAVIKDAAEAHQQSTQSAGGEILSVIHGAMAAAETKDQRMAQADRMDSSPAQHRSSQADPMAAIKTSTDGDGKAGQNNSQNPQHNANNKSAQGWESFWEKVNTKSSTQGAAATVRDTGLDARPMVGQGTAATAAENAASRAVNTAPAPHRAVLHQVNSGILQNLGQGRQQLTLHLNPPELGSLTVNLKVVGKEVQAVLRADTSEARQIIAENMHLIRQSLESSGLRVAKLEVQAQLQEHNQFTQSWQGMEGQKFQENGSKTQWGALGRGQTRDGVPGEPEAEGPDQSAILQALGREGRIDLIA